LVQWPPAAGSAEIRASGIRPQHPQETAVPHRISLILAAALIACAAQAQVVYPAKGQSASQQQKDQSECQAWAQSQGGSAPPPQGAPVARGAARGAVGGAVIAGVADGDTGKGAAAGAVVGGVRGGRERQAQQAQASSNTQKGYAACMEGRGYTVK
jgi:hypothetical protein